MAMKPPDPTEPPPRKKVREPNPSTEAAIVEKRSNAQQGAFEKLHTASFGLGDLAKSAADQLSKVKTDAVLSIAGFKTADIVKNLPVDVVTTLAKGKQLQEAKSTNPQLGLSDKDSETIAQYQKYHDQIVGEALKQNSVSAALLDKKVMIDELNESIASRYRNEIEPNESQAKSGEVHVEPARSAAKSKNEEDARTDQIAISSAVKDVPQLSGLVPAENSSTQTHLLSRQDGSASSDAGAVDTGKAEGGKIAAGKAFATVNHSENNQSDGVKHKSQDTTGTLLSTRTPATNQSEAQKSSAADAPIYKDSPSNANVSKEAAAFNRVGESTRSGAVDSTRKIEASNSPPAFGLNTKHSPDEISQANSARPNQKPSHAFSSFNSIGSLSADFTNAQSNRILAHSDAPHDTQDAITSGSRASLYLEYLPARSSHQMANQVYSANSKLESSKERLDGPRTIHAVNTIDSPQSLIRTSKSNAPHMVRPFFAGIVIHRENQSENKELYLTIHSSLSSNLIGIGRAFVNIASDNSSHQSTTFLAPGALNRNLLGTERAVSAILSTVGLESVRSDQSKSESQSRSLRNELALTTIDKTAELQPQPRRGVTTTIASRQQTAQELASERLKSTKISPRVESPVGRPPAKQTNAVENTRRPSFQVETGKAPLRIQPSLMADFGNANASKFVRQSVVPGRDSARYTFGTEIALVALLASGGISRRKVDSAAPASTELTQNKTSGIDAAGERNPKVIKIADGTQASRISVKTTRVAPDAGTQQMLPAKEQSLNQRGRIFDPTNRSIEENKSAESREKLLASLQRQMQELVRRLSIQPVQVFATPQGDLFLDAQKSSDGPKFANQIFRQVEGHIKDTSLSDTDATRQSPAITNGATILNLQRPSVLMAIDDTLISIAETFFHDPNLGWLIASLNSKTTRQAEIEGRLVVTLFSRQKLVLPVFEPDIVQFYAQEFGDRSIEELVTIVEETEIDRELMSSILGGVVGENRKAVQEKKKQIDTKTPSAGQCTHLSFDD